MCKRYNIKLLIQELIAIGAQTLVIPGNFPIGCSSAHLTEWGSEGEEYDPTTGCLNRLNQFAEYHNQLLQMKLNQIRELHPSLNIVYADYYNAAMQIYRSPFKFGKNMLLTRIIRWCNHYHHAYLHYQFLFAGFTNGALRACCGGGGPFNYNSTATCGHESATVCDEPNTYVNWDGVHLTEAAYKVIFNGLFQGPHTTPKFSSLCPSLSQLGGSSSSY